MVTRAREDITVLGWPLVMDNPSERPEDAAALELLYGTGTRDMDRWIAWVVADVLRQWGMPLPWPIARPDHCHDGIPNHHSKSAQP